MILYYYIVIVFYISYNYNYDIGNRIAILYINLIDIYLKGYKEINAYNILVMYKKIAIMLLIVLPKIVGKLVWIADIANPGARYPINDIYDGNANASLQGMLNSVGMRQQYLLGTYLRADYVDQ